MDINTPGSSGRTHVRQDSQPAQHKRKKKNHYRAMSRKLLVLARPLRQLIQVVNSVQLWF